MATITTRVQGASPKGSPLTNAEVDNNFINLNTAKYESGDNVSLGTGAFSGAVTIKNSDYSSGGLNISRNLDVTSVGAVAVKQRFGSVYNGSTVYPVEVLGGVANDGSALYYRVDLDSTNRMTLWPSEAAFNEDGGDVDFRVESDGNANMFFVDGGSDRIGIGTNAPKDALDLYLNKNISFTNTAQSHLRFNANADGQFTTGTSAFRAGQYIFNVGTGYHAIQTSSNAGANGSGISGWTNLWTGYTWSNVFNEDGIDMDFRVESDTNSNMFVVDSGNNWVRINEGGGQSTVDSFITEGSASINGFRVIRGQSWGSWAANTDYYLCSMNPGSNGSSAAANIDILSTGANVSASFRVVAKNAGGTTSPYAYCTGTNTSTLQLVAYRDNSNVAVIHFYVRPTSSVSYTPRATVTGHGSVVYDPSAPSAAVDDDWVWSSDSVFANKIGVGTSSPSGAMEVHTGYGTSTAFYVSQKKTYGVGTGIAENARVVLSLRESGAASDREFADFKAQTVQETSSTDGRLTVSTRQNGALVERMVMEPGTTIFNETSQNQDFRVESDANGHMLFVDAENNRVGIGDSTPVAALSVAGDILRRSYHGTTVATYIGIDDAPSNWYSVGSSGDLVLKAMNSYGSGNYQQSGGNIYIKAGTPYSNGTSGGDVILQSRANAIVGTTRPHVLIKHESTSVAEFDDREVTINEESNDIDFRVESDAHSHALFVDSGKSAIAVNKAFARGSFNVSGLGRNFSNATLYDGYKDGTGGTGNAGVGYSTVYLYSTDAAAQDIGPSIGFRAESGNTLEDVTYAIIGAAKENSTTDGSGSYTPQSKGYLSFHVSEAYDFSPQYGTRLKQRLKIGSTGALTTYPSADGHAVFNEGGYNADFRVETDTNNVAFVVDAGANSAYFGGTPSYSGANANCGVLFEALGGENHTILNTNKTNQNMNIAKVSGFTNGNYIVFFHNSAVTGSIGTDGTSVTYNTTSDARLKFDVNPITDGTEKLLAMKPVTHRWKAAPDDAPVHGFIAQDMQEVMPEAVSHDYSEEKLLSMDYGRITPIIVAALQDAHKKIAELEARLNELEGK